MEMPSSGLISEQPFTPEFVFAYDKFSRSLHQRNASITLFFPLRFVSSLDFSDLSAIPQSEPNRCVNRLHHSNILADITMDSVLCPVC